MYIDIESLEQVDLTNTDAKLNVATATTKFKSVETEFLQIEINGELQTVLFHYVPEKDLTMSNGISTKDDSFTGSVYSTDLDGRVLSGFEVNKGSITGEYRLPTSSIGPIPLNEVIIKNTYKAQTYYGGIYFNNSDYTRTPNYLNNYSSLGVAYAAYYKYLQTKKINDEIKVFADIDNDEKIIKKKFSYLPTKKDYELIKNNILFENEYYLVLNKPYNLAVQSGTKTGKNIFDILKNYSETEYSTPYLVHRLDAETTGILIISKTHKSAKFFSDLFKNQTIKKSYLAVVEGVLNDKIGTLRNELSYVENNKEKLYLFK